MRQSEKKANGIEFVNNKIDNKKMCSIIKKSHTLLNSTKIRIQGDWSMYCSSPFNEGLLQNILTEITIYKKEYGSRFFSADRQLSMHSHKIMIHLLKAMR